MDLFLAKEVMTFVTSHRVCIIDLFSHSHTRVVFLHKRWHFCRAKHIKLSRSCCEPRCALSLSLSLSPSFSLCSGPRISFHLAEMKVVSLFSGIGGLDHGLEQAGHEVILQVEKDPHCLQVLQRHFPGREIRRDVAELTELPAEAELLAAGFPCEVRIFPFFSPN